MLLADAGGVRTLRSLGFDACGDTMRLHQRTISDAPGESRAPRALPAGASDSTQRANMRTIAARRSTPGGVASSVAIHAGWFDASWCHGDGRGSKSNGETDSHEMDHGS